MKGILIPSRWSFNISRLSSLWPPQWKHIQFMRTSCRDCYYYHAHLCLRMDLTYGLSPLWLYECSHTNHFDRSAKQTGPWWWQYLWDCRMHCLPTHWDVYLRKTCQKHLMFQSYWRDRKFHSGMWGEEEENFNHALTVWNIWVIVVRWDPITTADLRTAEFCYNVWIWLGL